MIKRWTLKKPDSDRVKDIVTHGCISPLAARSLVMQGIDTMEKAAAFFGQDKEERYLDPFDIMDMDKAADIIADAVENERFICIYGDYDCDGITATAVMTDYLENIGANVIPYINERAEGYGMNPDAVRKLHEKGVELIITVDNGIAAIDEAKLCKELGMELIVTDHHQPGDELPCAAAVVDPHRKDDTCGYEDYCGCGLALKLVAAVEQKLGGDDPDSMDFAIDTYGDLCAVATVADVVPLTAENRLLVQDGMIRLANTERPGLAQLIEKAGIKEINSTALAFGIAPKINAAGRIASPSEALSLLMCDDEEMADRLADRVMKLNAERQSLTDEIYRDIAEQVNNDPYLLNRRVLVFVSKGWHHGVIGIAAARLVEIFDKPAFVMTEEENGELRGSARSCGDFNVFDSLVFCSEHLTKKGGHSGAGGFSLEKKDLQGFMDGLEKYAASLPERPVTQIPVCADLTASDITVENVEGLSILEPFGEQNPQPVFLFPDCVVTDIMPMSEGAHTRLTLDMNGTKLDAPIFRQRTEDFPYKKGDRLNILASLGVNEWNGRKSIRLRVIDMRRKGIKQEKLINAEDYYDRFRRGELTDERLLKGMTPDRGIMGKIYLNIKGKSTPHDLYSSLGDENVNYCMLLNALDIFDEAGLISYDRFANTVERRQVTGKADLTLTPTYKKLTKAV